jgi:hypothetical protein
MTLDDFLVTPDGKALAAEMADDLLYYNQIMPDTTERTKQAMDAYMRGVMDRLLKKDQN